MSLRLTPASTVRAPPSANLRGNQNPNRDPDACSDHTQKQMQQMTSAGTSCQHLLRAHLTLPLFTLLSHYAIPHKKSTTHNPTNPITPASTRHQNRGRVGSIMPQECAELGGKSNHPAANLSAVPLISPCAAGSNLRKWQSRDSSVEADSVAPKHCGRQTRGAAPCKTISGSK